MPAIKTRMGFSLRDADMTDFSGSHKCLPHAVGGSAIVSLAVLGLLSGCMVGPNYKPPVVKLHPEFHEIQHPPTTQASVPTTRPVQVTQWWANFRDPELDSLVQRAVAGNLTFRQASSRVRQARYQRDVVGTSLFPEVNVGGGYQHARGSQNVVIPLGAFGGGGGSRARANQSKRANPKLKPAAATINQGREGGPQSPFGSGGFPGVDTDLTEAGFDASWEIDVFGGQRRADQAADYDTQAAIDDRRSALVSLVAEVARTYINLRGYQRQAEIAHENLAAQQDTLRLTTSKFKAGFVTQLDVARQATQVATTAASLPPVSAKIRIAIHTLGVLLGEDPDALSVELSNSAPIPPVPPEVPIGIPADLLRRRPDVRAAERQLAAATARIGQATADLYPKFSITGALGLDSTASRHLFDWGSRYYSFSPGITWPIFDAGRIHANIHVQTELQQQALANYQQTVLNALKEVEDALASYRTEQVRRQALSDAVTSAQEAVNLAKQQYDQGVVDFLTVLDAERAEFGTEDSLAQSDQAISVDLVQLYKALGGGWQILLSRRPMDKSDVTLTGG